jgi:DNA-binding LacI/PurR family transcriptional regulator
MANATKSRQLRAEIVEALDDKGEPMVIAHVFEDGEIYDAISFKDRAAAREWVRQFYGIEAEDR